MLNITIRPRTELYLGHGVLSSHGLSEHCGARKKVLIADSALADLYAVDLGRRIGAELLTIPSGESAKTFASVQHLVDTLFKMGADRDTLLIALGGGATTDLVGFVASIYMRGVPLILIPTTLLAIVDAAIGGKTAINTPNGKNLVGTIYPPQAIFADLDLLQTLPEKERFNGLAEILKMGLIRDPAIWALAAQNRKDPHLILKAIQGKIAVVEQDPTEQSLRRILNFGHTIGHALETVSHYAMSHGEAVALGCVAEAHLSLHLGYLAAPDFAQIEAVYRAFPLALPKAYTRDNLIQAMSHDKKNARGEIRCVLIDKIGHAVPFDATYCRTVTQSELEPTLHWMEHWKSGH